MTSQDYACRIEPNLIPMFINRTGIIRIIALISCVIVGLILARWITNIGLAVAVGISISTYVYYNRKLYRDLQHANFALLGLKPKTIAAPLQDYYIGTHETITTHHVFESSVAEFPFSIINFSITRGSDKQKSTFEYIGFEFITHQDHYAVQLRKPNSPIEPVHSELRQLEGNEFQQWFSVYSMDPRAPFYFFDPDTMSDLIDLRRQLKLAFNMDVAGNKILIFMNAPEMDKQFFGKVSLWEILNGQPNLARKNNSYQATRSMLETLNQIFALLDYKLQKR